MRKRKENRGIGSYKTFFYEAGDCIRKRFGFPKGLKRTLSKDKKMRPVGFEPTFPVLTNLACYSTLLWSLLRRVVSIHRLLGYTSQVMGPTQFLYSTPYMPLWEGQPL